MPKSTTTTGPDKAAIKAGTKNAKQHRKNTRKAANAKRNGYVAAVRFVAAAAPFSYIILDAVLKARSGHGDPEHALLPAVISFFLVWVVLGFAERAISTAIAKHATDERIQARRIAAETAASLAAAASAAAAAAMADDVEPS
jgi:hypothetical protein